MHDCLRSVWIKVSPSSISAGRGVLFAPACPKFRQKQLLKNMAINRVRRGNLLMLVGDYPRRVFCEHTGLAACHISQLIAGHQDIDEGTARQIEAGLKLPSGWMDLAHYTPDSKAGGIPEDLPSNEHALLMKFRQLDLSEQIQVCAMIDTFLATKRTTDNSSES